MGNGNFISELSNALETYGYKLESLEITHPESGSKTLRITAKEYTQS